MGAPAAHTHEGREKRGGGRGGERWGEKGRTASHTWIEKEINGALCEGNKKQRQCEAVRDHQGF